MHESQLFRQLWEKLEKGDVILADRGFCSYAAIASLAQRGVDSVMRLHQMRKADFRSGKALGKGERRVIWTKPAQRTPVWSAAEFAALPDRLVLRMINLEVAAPGFRTRRVILITTLLDQELYPAEEVRARSMANAGASNSTFISSKPSCTWISCVAKVPPSLAKNSRFI